MNKLSCFFPATMIFLFMEVSCMHNLQQSEATIPEPKIVDHVELPASLDAVYYLISPSKNATLVFEELLENAFELIQAWAPTQQTPCDCLTCVNAIIIEIKTPNERIHEFNFISDPEPWAINCGVNSFEYYDFVNR